MITCNDTVATEPGKYCTQPALLTDIHRVVALNDMMAMKAFINRVKPCVTNSVAQAIFLGMRLNINIMAYEI